MTSDAIQVDAEIVEVTTLSKPDMPDVVFHPASIDADFDAMLAWASNLRTIYQAAEFTEDEVGYREAKAARAAIRTYMRDIDNRRKAVKAEYSAPLVAFESRVKLVTSALGDAADACDQFAKGWEDAGKARKKAAIREAYEDYAPLLVPVLPFDRFYDLMLQGGRKWQNATPKISKCIEEMQDDVERIATDWETVKAYETGHPDVAEREFFRTLDVGQATRAARAADDEDARIAAMRAEMERVRAEQEAARQRAAMEQPVYVTPEPMEFDAPVPLYNPLPEIENVRQVEMTEHECAPVETHDYVIVLKAMSEPQARAARDALLDWYGTDHVSMYKGSPMDAAIQMSMRR